MTIEEITDLAETLEDALTALDDSTVESINPEAEFYDEDDMPIPAWKVEDREDEITEAKIIVRVRFTDDNRNASFAKIAEIIAAAAESGIELEESATGDSRWSSGRLHGIQINLESANLI